MNGGSRLIAVTGLRWNANQVYAKCVLRLHWNERRLRWLDRPLTKISQRAADLPKPGGQVPRPKAVLALSR